MSTTLCSSVTLFRSGTCIGVFILLVLFYWTRSPDEQWRECKECVLQQDRAFAALSQLQKDARFSKPISWPPKRMTDIFNKKVGMTNLQLHPLVEFHETATSSYLLQQELEKFINQSGGQGESTASTLRQLYNLDKEHNLKLAGITNYGYYPQFINITEAILNVTKLLPLNEPPINNPLLPVVHWPTSICDALGVNGHITKKLDLLVIIKSGYYNFDQRAKIRSTFAKQSCYKKLRVRFVFSVGLPAHEVSSFFQFEEFNVSLLNAGGPELNYYRNNLAEVYRKLSEEIVTHDDLLVGGYIESYYNLTKKMLLNLRWAEVFCKDVAPVFLFMDDDYAIMPNNMEAYILSANVNALKQLLAGSVFTSNPVNRPSTFTFFNKWANSENTIPWHTYPPYTDGFGTFIGSSVLQRISIALSFTQEIMIDDAYLGFVARKLGVNFTNIVNLHSGIITAHRWKNAIMCRMKYWRKQNCPTEPGY